MCAKATLKAEVIEGMGIGREAFDVLVSVGMLPKARRPSNTSLSCLCYFVPTHLILPVIARHACFE